MGHLEAHEVLAGTAGQLVGNGEIVLRGRDLRPRIGDTEVGGFLDGVFEVGGERLALVEAEGVAGQGSR